MGLYGIAVFGKTTGTTSAYQRRAEPTPALPSNHRKLIATNSYVEQIHLALGDNNAIVVSWVTPRFTDPTAEQVFLAARQQNVQQPSCTTDAVASIVRYGFHSNKLTSTAQGSYSCYSAGSYDSGLLHSVALKGLLPNTTYFYTCGDPSKGWSQEYNFTTPPVTGPASLPYRLAIVGDLGQTSNSAETVDHIIASEPGLVMLPGDFSYADGDQPRWDSWGRLLQPALARLPLMGLPGNHEMENGLNFRKVSADTQKGLASTPRTVDPPFVAYETRFSVPSRTSGSDSPLWYSFEVSGAHFVMLNAYSAYDKQSPQYAWLQRDLAKVDRRRTPWLIAMFHAPWYNSNYAHQGEADAMAEAMEPLLYAAHVDMVFSGHVHAYERSARVYEGQADKCGPMYIVIGDGGNREGLAGGWRSPQPEWSLFRESSYGHGVLDLVNSTHAQWRWIRNDDGKGVAADELWVERSAECVAPQQQQVQQQGQKGEVVAGATAAVGRGQYADGVKAAVAKELGGGGVFA